MLTIYDQVIDNTHRCERKPDMNDALLLIAIALILVVAMMVLNRSVRLWVFRVLGMESRVENMSHQTQVKATRKSSVKDVHNEGCVLDATADDESSIENVRNER